jgi:hypothetical protein
VPDEWLNGDRMRDRPDHRHRSAARPSDLFANLTLDFLLDRLAFKRDFHAPGDRIQNHLFLGMRLAVPARRCCRRGRMSGLPRIPTQKWAGRKPAKAALSPWNREAGEPLQQLVKTFAQGY